MHPLHHELRRLVAIGTFDVRWPDGHATRYVGETGPHVGLRIGTWATATRLLLHPGLAFGEAYTAGTVTPVGCDLYALLDLFFRNRQAGGTMTAFRVREPIGRALRRLTQWNSRPRARRNVRHHYDLPAEFYALFLDDDRQYSCAYFPTGDETLDEAQALKKAHIAAKLRLDRPGLRVLDVGCGWGGLALTLARDHRADVTGITLSAEQLAFAQARAERAGLADRVRFELRDYRSLSEPFDRIVSVGMFEHVGLGSYRAFFRALRRCLAPDGVALLHTIGRAHGPGATAPWIRRHVFPGGYSPALGEIVPAIEQSGLLVTDVEVLRLHYAHTLRLWRERFAAHRAAAAAITGEAFCRLWEFYLAGSELAFRHQGHVNFQIQMTRAIDALPLTRDYMAAGTDARLSP